MKKLVMTLLLAGLVSVPLAAQEPQPQGPKGEEHQAFAKAQKEHRAKMQATQEKMEKLVKEYNKLKEGKKKDAKRGEIEKEVAAIHEEQLKFKAEQLVKFEERLGKMKADFAQENSADGKKAWVDQRTQALVENEGDLRVLFDPKEGPGPRMDGPRHGRMHGHQGHKKCAKDGKCPFGPKGPHFGKGPKMDGKDGNFPPPPDAELPVQKPVAK